MNYSCETVEKSYFQGLYSRNLLILLQAKSPISAILDFLDNLCISVEYRKIQQ